MADEVSPARVSASDTDSAHAWVRLSAALAVSTIGGIGMWSYVVALPTVQAEFGIPRALASVPYTATMLGFGLGGILMGRISDRYGIFLPVIISAFALCLGFNAAALSQDLWQLTLAHGLLIGLLGSAAVFGPMLADISRWFVRRRGLAVAICASGNYLAGTVWPPVMQYAIEAFGWRMAHVGVGIVCLATMLPLALMLRRPPPRQPDLGRLPATPTATGGYGRRERRAPLSHATLMVLLTIAGLACCMAMAMPQVHIVALCGDLGFGPARGAEMLALMMGMGVISRLASGYICDRIGGLLTLLVGSTLQAVALLLYLPADGLVSLYVVSALFGLFQGGIVPSYTIIVREYFPAAQAGIRVGIVLFATLIGMALGGWLSGQIFDLTGSYDWAFLNGIAWNALNLSIAVFLLIRLGRAGPRPRLSGPLASPVGATRSTAA